MENRPVQQSRRPIAVDFGMSKNGWRGTAFSMSAYQPEPNAPNDTIFKPTKKGCNLNDNCETINLGLKDCLFKKERMLHGETP